MKGVGLRRQQRHAGGQSAVPSNDAPVPVVFRVHSDTLSKAQFLFCPKNFNLANPSTAPSAASANCPSRNDICADGDSPRDAIETLVEAFVELRPFFPATTAVPRSASTGVTAAPNGVNHSSGSTTSFSSTVREAPLGSPSSFASPTSTSEPNAGQPQRGLYRHPHFFLDSHSSVPDLASVAPAAALASPVLYTSFSDANLNNSMQAALGGGMAGSHVGGTSSSALATSSFVDLYALSTYVSSTAERLENDRYGADHHHHHVPSSGAGPGGGGGLSSAHGKRGDAGTSASAVRGGGSGGGASLRSAARASGGAGGAIGIVTGTGGGGSGSSGAGADFAGDGHSGSVPLLMHPCGSWICRAMAFNERETVHANGAISVNQSLTLKCPIVNELAKGKTMAKLVSYEEVRERFGLSHVELAFEHQYVSRSDMFLISEALRERVLYEGEELSVCGFRFKTNELLQTFHAVTVTPASPTAATAHDDATHTDPTSPTASSMSTGFRRPTTGNVGAGASAAIPLTPNSLQPKRGASASTNADGHGGNGGSGNPSQTKGGGAGAAQMSYQRGARNSGSSSSSRGLTRSGSKEDAASAGLPSTTGGGGGAAAAAADSTDVPEKRDIRVGCGLVTSATRVNFRSLSPVYYLVVELTYEMWATTRDGRIYLTWALKKFIRELLLQQLPRRRASPLLRVIFTGRLRREFMFSSESDIFHMLEIPQDTRGTDIAEEVERHCEALVERVVREVKEEALRRLVLDDADGAWEVLSPTPDGYPVAQPHPRAPLDPASASSSSTARGEASTATADATAGPTASAASASVESALHALEVRVAAIERLTPKDIFVHAKQSNTLEALSIILEQCTHHYIDRRLHSTGHCVTVVTAGKGHYHTSNGLVQINCTRMHDLGLERVHFVCIGRPPLHATPLLEYTTQDETLRAQYHLPYGGGPHDGHQSYFEVPEWARCFFYYPVLGTTSGETRFELLTKRAWLRRYTTTTTPITHNGLEGVSDSGRTDGVASARGVGGSPRVALSGVQTSALMSSLTLQSRTCGREHSHVSGSGGGGDVSPQLASSVVVGMMAPQDGSGTGAAAVPAVGDALSESVCSVPAAPVNGQRVLLQGLGLSMCPPQVVVLPAHFTDTALRTNAELEADADLDEDDKTATHSRHVVGAAGPSDDNTSSLLTLRRMSPAIASDSAGGSSDLLSAHATQPVPTNAVAAARDEGNSSSDAPHSFSLPRSLEAYRRGEAPLCVSRSYDFRTTSNPLLHISGAYHYSQLSSSSASGRREAGMRALSSLGRNAQDGHSTPHSPQYSMEVDSLAYHTVDDVPATGTTADDMADVSSLAARRSRGVTRNWTLYGTWFSLHGLNSGAKSGVSTSASGGGGAGNAVGMGASAGVSLGSLSSAVVMGGAAAELVRCASLTERVLRYMTASAAREAESGGNAATISAAVPPPPWYRAAGDAIPEAAPCGLNVLDSDMKGGYLLLQLTLASHRVPRADRPRGQNSADRSDYYWSPRALMEDQSWALLMSCFSSRDDRAGREEEEDGGSGSDVAAIGRFPDTFASSAARSSRTAAGRHLSDLTGGGDSAPAAQAPTGAVDGPSFQCDFRPSEVFCRLYSGITADGRTLVLATHANDVTIHNPEELRFTVHPSLLTSQQPGSMSEEDVAALCSGFTDSDAVSMGTDAPLPTRVTERHTPHSHTAIDQKSGAATDEREGSAQVRTQVAHEAESGVMAAMRDNAPRAPALHWRVGGTGFSRVTATVGYVQLRDRLLFAIKPTDPLHPTWDASPSSSSALSAEAGGDGGWMLPRSAATVTTETVFRRRWIYQHPEVSLEAPHVASWTQLCTCKMLPLYGIKPAYTREGFYTVPPHQYSLSDTSKAAEKSKTLEFVLQRLQQQYQIVDHGGLSAQWPRADPSPNMRVDMSIGHQMHTLKIGETTKTISVSRMLHRGMYSNAQVTHMLSYRYTLWNYLSDVFDAREVHMESQVGEKNAYSWEALDRWIQKRPDAFIPHSSDTWLRAREVAVALLPDDPARPPPFEEFHNFIGYRFSVHLSTRGKVEWVADDGPLRTSIPPLTSPEAAEYPEPPSLMEVVLTHDNPRAFETRSRVDPHTGRTIAFEQPVEERFMLVDIDLHHRYNPGCTYLLKVAWLGCAASIVADWHGSFIANAGRYHFRVVPIPCYYQNPRTDTLTVRYDVEVSEQEEATVRRRLLRLLTDPAFRYYPDTTVMNRHCRLIHLSGLCFVVVPPSSTLIAQWYQNALMKQGTPQQQELFRQFRHAVDLAKSDVSID